MRRAAASGQRQAVNYHAERRPPLPRNCAGRVRTRPADRRPPTADRKMDALLAGPHERPNRSGEPAEKNGPIRPPERMINDRSG